MKVLTIQKHLENDKTKNNYQLELYIMIQLVGDISALNQNLLNKIIAELAQSMLKPTLEFDEILLECFMYPRGLESLLHKYEFENNASTMEHKHDFNLQDIGHAQLLEIIHIRKVILDTQSSCKALDQNTGFVLKIQELFNKIECLVYELLKRLSVYIEVPKCSKLYRSILTKQLPNFNEFFSAYKMFNAITNSLLETAVKTGQDTTKYFNVDVSLSDTITKFIKSNDKWMHQMLLESTSFQEFRLIRSKCDSKAETSSFSSTNDTCCSSFTEFNQERKNRLRIQHRSI